MPLLVLIRHAKAEAHASDDHSREIAARGRAEAEELRQWLLHKAIRPDRVVVSTAVRARQTWECCSVGDVQPVYDDRVYEASVPDLLEVLRDTPEDTGTVVLVGHNPSVEKLAWKLDISEPARDRTDRGLPTCGVAVFEVAGWADLTAGRLVDLKV